MCFSSPNPRRHGKKRSSSRSIHEFHYSHRVEHASAPARLQGGRLHISGDINVLPETMEPVYYPAEVFYAPHHQFGMVHPGMVPPMAAIQPGNHQKRGLLPAPGQYGLLPEEDEHPVAQSIKENVKDQLKSHQVAVGKEFGVRLKETDEALANTAKKITDKVDAVTRDVATIKAAQSAEAAAREKKLRAREISDAREEGRAEERKRMAARDAERERELILEWAAAAAARDNVRIRNRRIRSLSPDSEDTNSYDSAFGDDNNNMARAGAGGRLWAQAIGEPCPTNNPHCTGFCAHHPELRREFAPPVIS